MTQHRNLDYGQRVPEAVFDALQQLVGTYVSPNFRLSKASSTALQVVAGADNDQVCIAINGKWRYITATVNASHPGGLAGQYDVYVTGSDNNFVAGDPETDLTVYDFALAIRATGSPPATALYRKVATLTWDGTQITAVQPLIGDLGSAVVVAPDSQIRNRITTTNVITNVVSGMRSGDAAERVVLSETGLAVGPGTGATDVALTRDATGPRWTSSVPVNATGFQVSGTALAASHLSNGVTGSGSVVLAASPALTGTPTAPTAAAGTSTTQLATTAFVIGQASNTNPLMDGAVAQGTSDRYARQDHVHPTDTSRAPLASPTFTGVPAAPTAAVDTSTTQLATTAFVVGQGYGKKNEAVGNRTSAMWASLTWVEGVLPGHGAGDVQTDPQQALKVGAPTGWTLPISPGYALIQGDDSAQQGLYAGVQASAGSVTMTTTQPATNPRVDAIVVRWNDADYTARTPQGQLVYEQVVGTATAGANLTNLTGAPGQAGGPAFPPSALLLAYVLVNPADTTGPQAGNVQDQRRLAGPAIWGEDGKRYRLGIDASGVLGVKAVYP